MTDATRPATQTSWVQSWPRWTVMFDILNLCNGTSSRAFTFARYVRSVYTFAQIVEWFKHIVKHVLWLWGPRLGELALLNPLAGFTGLLLSEWKGRERRAEKVSGKEGSLRGKFVRLLGDIPRIKTPFLWKVSSNRTYRKPIHFISGLIFLSTSLYLHKAFFRFIYTEWPKISENTGPYMTQWLST